MEESSNLLRNSVNSDEGNQEDGEVHYKIVRSKCTKVPTRYVLGFMMFLGFLNVFTQRMVFNIALVAMVNFTETTNVNDSSTGECPADEKESNKTTIMPGPTYNWDAALQGILLGAFYYGYTASQLLGGYLADRFGSKYIYAVMGAGNGLLSLIIPVVANWNPYVLVAVRALQGLLQGPLYPTCVTILSRWMVPEERTKMYGFINAGATLGTVLSMAITGFLCQSPALGGWPSAFYLFGGLTLVWTVFWMLLAHDTPAVHPRITPEERQYIERETEDLDTVKFTNPPWHKILTSLPLWGVFVLLISDNFCFYVTFNCMPLYMKQVLRFDMSQDGVMSALPYIVQLPITFLAGWQADFVRQKNLLRVVNIRRLGAVLGDAMPGIFLVVLGFVGCQKSLAVAMLVLSLCFNAFIVTAPTPALFDLAPMYAGTIMGLMNGLSNAGGFIAPLFVASITGNSGNQYEWRTVFYITAGIYLCGVIVFCLLLKDKELSWAKDKRTVPHVDSGTSSGENSPNLAEGTPLIRKFTKYGSVPPASDR